MSNVRRVHGSPERREKIRDMEIGQVGWTVPWAYDEEKEELDLDYSISADSGGTATLFVRCIGKELYEIDFTGGAFALFGVGHEDD